MWIDKLIRRISNFNYIKQIVYNQLIYHIEDATGSLGVTMDFLIILLDAD